MRQVRCGVLFVVVLLVLFGTAPRLVSAQSSDLAGHPIVGSWLLDTDLTDPKNAVSLVAFTADGIYMEVDDDGTTGLGSWASTGDTTGEMTLRFVDADGIAIIRASLEVSATDDMLRAEYTIEFVDPEGVSTGEYGPGKRKAPGQRSSRWGQPVGTLEDLFSTFGEPEATPVPD